jgi:1-deoxy-D-xylulose-5-phosphate reductoisomerase
MTMPAVMSAANEVAVDAFLNHRIGFKHIEKVIENVMSAHEPVKSSGISDILSVAAWARRKAEESL